MLDKIKHYFQDELWNFSSQDLSGFRKTRVKWLRIAYLTFRGFYQNHCSLSASSLTYYTLMSIVPVVAMVFAISRGFGYYEPFRLELLRRFQDHQVALQEIFKYADRFLEEARGGVIAGVGLGVLFLTVILLMSNLETILNQIWGVHKLRSWRRIVSDYLAVMLIGPVFFLFANSMAVFVVDQLEMGIRLLPLSMWIRSWLLFFVNAIPYCLFWILFTFFYMFMPNTKVRFRSACLGGFFAGCIYLAVQWGYIYFQIGVNRYGAIYGSMAALPLFMIWLQVSWLLFLLGAQISYTHQTLSDHEFAGMASRVSHSFKRLVTLWIVHLAIKKGFLTTDLLVQRYQIPVALAKPILQELVVCQILHETRGGFTPAHTAIEMRISDVIEALDTQGEKEFPFIHSKALSQFEQALESFRQQIESSPHNIRLSHVPNPL